MSATVDIKPYPHSATTICNHCDHAFAHTGYQLDSAVYALRLNYSPEGHEALDILRTINDIDSQFERYDPEIARTQGILASLQEQRRNLEWYKECYRSILSPIRKLPPEILQNIFLACRGGEPDVIPTAGQVCRYWRDIVVGTPELWSIISVGRTRYTFTERYRNLASLFLERSGSQPLSICIRNPADTRLVECLWRHVNRWQTLRLSTRDTSFYGTLGLEAFDLGMLEKFELLEANTFRASDQTCITISQNAPKLCDVVLKNPLRYWKLPWGQLTRIQYDIPSAADGLRILQLCPQLVECSLDRMTEAAPDFAILRPSRKLRFLRLAVDTTSSPQSPPETILKTFFICLTAPDLNSLEVFGQWLPRDLTGFLTRSECKLESLTLGTGYMKDENIINVLGTLPHLKTLVLDADIGTSRQLQNRVITDNLLRRLTFYPDSDCMLPCLKHFALKTSLNFEDQTLLDMIESRWIPWVTELYGVRVSRLTSIDLHFCGKRDALFRSSVDDLRDFYEAGLRITLQRGDERICLLSSGD